MQIALQNGHTGDTLMVMNSDHRIPAVYKTIATWFERLLALVILGGVVVFAWASAPTLASMDWRLAETFYELVYRVLLVVIAIELARTLVTHDLRAILELLAFVVARKMLKPDVSVLDILLCVLAFVALLAANHWWLPGPAEPEGKEAEETDRSASG